MNVPKLRFKEFCEEWENSKKLQYYLVSLQSGKSKFRLNHGMFPFYGSTGIIGFTDSPDYEGKTLLIARVGANAGDLYSVKGNYSVSDNTLMVKVSEKNDFNFFKYLLERFNINRLVFGSGQPLVTGGQLKELLIGVPALPEQTKIGSFLTVIDEKIAQLTQKHALLNQYKKGMMQQIFSQALRFKDENGEEFGDWKSKKIIDFAPLQRGFDLPVDAIKQGTYPVVFSNGILKYHNEYKVKGVGVVTGRSGTIGNVTFVEQDYWPHNTSLWVTNFYDNYPKFVYYFYIHFDLIKFSTGSGVPTLNRNDVHSQYIYVPTLPEQTKIANFLSSIDQKIEQVAAQLDVTKQYKRGLLQQMFV